MVSFVYIIVKYTPGPGGVELLRRAGGRFVFWIIVEIFVLSPFA